MTSLAQLSSKLEFNGIADRLRRYASSEPGRKLMDEIVPFRELPRLREELGLVTESKTVLEFDDACPLDGIKDIRDSIHKASIENNFITAPELRDVFTTQKAARLIKHYFGKRTSRYSGLAKLAAILFVDRVLEYNIEQAIDENGNVRDTASKELREIRAAIISKTDALRVKLEGILKGISEQGFAQEEIITTRDGRMVVPVKVEHKHHVPGFIHSSSASGATVFIEPAETLEMNNEIRSLQFNEQREVERVLRALTTQVRGSKNELLLNIEVLARLDSLLAKGKYSIEILGAQPQVGDGPSLRLVEARHPILLQKHHWDEVAPLTLEIGEGFNTLVITGPNAGGKTVALKTVGLLSLMTACGLHIPAQGESQIPLFHDIFIDIGDEQSIENDLSSFSSHLLAMKLVTEQADDHSLVLIDEIGAGTDPAEGGALAAAVLKELSEKKCLTIATTHHGVLKAFAHETHGFANGSMEFDQTTLQPTYRYRPGIPGSSYALQIAERLRLPPGLVSRAKEYLGSKKDTLESLLATVEQKAQELEKQLVQVRLQNAQLDDLIREYEEKLRSADKDIRKKRLEALRQAEHVVQHANSLIESSIKEIKEKSADKSVVRKVKEDLQSLRKTIEDELEKSELIESELGTSSKLLKGDFVKLRGGAEVGEIVDVSSSGETLVVDFGSAHVHVDRKNVLPARKMDQRHTSFQLAAQPETIHREIDVRGMTADDAIKVVDKFLDDASLAAFPSICVIHGKGTGTLRKKITEYLKRNARVKSFRLGDWNEGGSGVTIIDLKS